LPGGLFSSSAAGVNRRALTRLGGLSELLAQLLGFLATDQFDHEVTRLFDVVIRALVILAPVVGFLESGAAGQAGRFCAL
jgi:hypothetical protein